jgi:hypothetical protein
METRIGTEASSRTTGTIKTTIMTTRGTTSAPLPGTPTTSAAEGEESAAKEAAKDNNNKTEKYMAAEGSRRGAGMNSSNSGSH